MGQDRFRAFALAVALVSLGGCASIKSDVKNRGDAASGFTYYMPMRFAEVTFTRTKLEDPGDGVAKAEIANKAVAAEKGKSDSALAKTTGLVEALQDANVPLTSETHIKALVAKAEAESVAKTMAAALQKTEAALSKKKAEAQAWRASSATCHYVDRFSAKLSEPVADPTKRFVANPKHWWGRNDMWNLKTNRHGLLSNVDGVVQDQSAEILVALARGRIAKVDRSAEVFVKEADSFRGEDHCEMEDWQEIVVTATINPAIANEWTTFLKEVSEKATVKKKGDPTKVAKHYDFSAVHLPALDARYVASTTDAKADGRGIFYRRDLPLVVTIKNGTAPVGSMLLTLPNISPDERLALPASAFVTTEHKLSLENGILLGHESTRPSEALAVASLPWTIAQATIDTLTQLIQFRVNYTTSNASLIEQQTTLINNLKAQLEAAQAFEDASANASSSTPIAEREDF